MRVSNSRLKTWRRCPNQFRYKYVLGLRSKKRSIPLERGTWIHELLMVHNDGEDWRVRHQELTRKFKNLFEEEREQLGDLPTECARIMKSYLRNYKYDSKRYVVVDTELDEIVTLPNGLEVQVIIDVVLWDLEMEGYWLKDYKTRKNFKDADNLILDPQLTLYYKAAEILGFTPILGTQTDEIRTKAPAVPETIRKGLGLSKRKNIDTDVFTYMEEIRRNDFDPDDYRDILATIAARQKDRFFRRTATPKDPPVVRQITKEAVQSANAILYAEQRNAYPRTHDDSCVWGCDFRDICIAELHGADIGSMIHAGFTQKKKAPKSWAQRRREE